MRLEKRLRALETRLRKEATVLFFSDGSTLEIRCELLDLFIAVCDGTPLSSEEAMALDAIRRSVGAREAGGARLTEVIRAALNVPPDPANEIAGT
jgi:hypothetical protein